MRAAVAQGAGVLELQSLADPTPTAGQAVIEVDACGVCGTDLHVLDGDLPFVRYPVVPGHEFGGTVVAVGRGVTHLGEGDRVVVDPMIFCGHCDSCQAGLTNQCENGGGLGTTADGAFAEFVAVDAARCLPHPPEMPVAWAPLVEPLSCVVHALDRIGPVLGRSTLVVGAGPSGLMMCALLRRAGAEVDVIERIGQRRARADKFGAARSAEGFDDLDQPDGWELIVDVTGSAGAIEASLERLRRTGHLHIFGVATPAARVALSPYAVFARELTITGSTSVLRSFGRALRLLAAGALPADLLVADGSPLERAADAIAAARGGHVLKARVLPSQAAINAASAARPASPVKDGHVA